MKQAIYREFGNPSDVLEIVESTQQALQPGQARIKVLRAPINPSDVAQISGRYGVLPSLPAAAGNEGVGEVVEVNGEGVKVGQTVLLPGSGGTWSTEMVGTIADLVPLPPGDIDQLSMLAVNPATAYLLLTDFVTLERGDWIIMAAANSGVGSYVLQLAKARGIKVVGVVRDDAAVQEVERAGADVVVVDGPDLSSRVRARTEAEMRLALDPVAGDASGRLAETLEYGGTLVVFGALSGAPSSVGYSQVIFNDGTLHAPVDRVFPLERLPEALEHASKRGRSGKVLLAPNGV